MRQSVALREMAQQYWQKSAMQSDFDLREHFAELAARYLDMAEKLEDETAIDAIAKEISS